MSNIRSPKKLIEVALPLDDINVASAREKSIRHGHPSTLHLWWARRPLAAARAVIFAQMVNDPGGAVDGRGSSSAAEQVVQEIEAAGGDPAAVPPIPPSLTCSTNTDSAPSVSWT